MPLPMFRRDDEELGKKDDEYKPRLRARVWSQRRTSHVPPRRSLKRITFVILGLVALCYLFSKTLYGEEEGSAHHNKGEVPIPNPSVSQTTPMKPATSTGPVMQDFNGPIKFYELAPTLHLAGRMSGSSIYNSNILFAAASLKSAAILLPIACEMALQDRNEVHFAFMGREDISMELLRSVNGIGKDCKIMFHDARPDFALQSTEFRMEVSCSAAFNHINTHVHPQAALIDGSGLEEPYFLKGVNERATSLQKTIIQLPENVDSLMWITLLDSVSLSAWNRVTVDLVIHAQKSASGSLIRLLESLKKADYFSCAPPRLTIELPNEIEEPTKQYLLHRFRWPPSRNQDEPNLLTLHHRIPQHGLTVEENSIRFLESFWPADPTNSHIVVLSPQAEVSPLFFHYLKYAMLEYKYSTRQYDASALLGISLDLPTTHLNDSTVFTPPLVNQTVTPFLWQAPNSNAALYFGEKWVELHDLVSHILTSRHKLPTSEKSRKNEVSKTYPSWLEHILNLARARGYYLLYPNFESVDSLVTLHKDLYRPPEEYQEEVLKTSEGELGADVKEYLSLKHKERPLVTTGFFSYIKAGGTLPLLVHLPVIGLDGETVDSTDLDKDSEDFAEVFRREVGGCDEKEPLKARVAGKTDDLFCLGGKLEA